MLSSLVALAILVALTGAQRLDNKPVLRDNLDDLDPGLKANLKSPFKDKQQWFPGAIPQACMDSINARNNNPSSGGRLSPRDFTVWNVWYNDVWPVTSLAVLKWLTRASLPVRYSLGLLPPQLLRAVY